MDSDGKILEESSYDNRHDEATKFAKDSKAKYVECQAVCESTGNHWIKTADALEKVGIPLELANPVKTKAIVWASIKNDKVDAKTLAHLLRSDLVASCYIGDSESRGKKQLIRHAIRLVHDQTRVINSLHPLTDKYDVDPKNGGSSVWREKALSYLDDMRLEDPSDQFAMEWCVSQTRSLNIGIAKTDGEVMRYVKGNHGTKLFLSMTGFDVFSAALMAAEIDDIKRFASPQDLIAWAGMRPTLHQSGDVEYHGQMSKATNRTANWIMIQCALVATVDDPRMSKYYKRLKTGYKPVVALAHLANKMLRIIWYMLTRNVTYEGTNNSRHRFKLKKVMDMRYRHRPARYVAVLVGAVQFCEVFFMSGSHIWGPSVPSCLIITCAGVRASYV